jgi:hypothetical protein
VLAEAEFRTAEQFNDMIIAQASGYPVRLARRGARALGALERAQRDPRERQSGGGPGHRQAVDRQHAVGRAGGQGELTRITKDCPKA